MSAEPAAPGLYLHVPFCSSICPYCDFSVVHTASPGRERFASRLAAEVELAAPEWRDPRPFDTVYLGGGTPSQLRHDELSRVLDACRAHLPLAAPAPIPSPVLPVVAPSIETGEIEVAASADWSPREMPAPAYTLKPSVRPQYARTIDESDLAGSSYAPAASRAAAAESVGGGDAQAPAASGQLDAILARRVDVVVEVHGREHPLPFARRRRRPTEAIQERVHLASELIEPAPRTRGHGLVKAVSSHDASP